MKRKMMLLTRLMQTLSVVLPERRKVTSYRDLIVWQRAMDLAHLVHEITRTFPNEERFGLTSQIQRSAASIPSNIAEGHGRTHLREYLHHLSIARGSLVELETQLAIAAQRKYLSGGIGNAHSI